MKKVSVALTIYNMADCVAKNLPCLINQTYKNIEIVIVDDGSTDDTLLICREAEKKDSRIKVFSKKNEGLGAARNLSLEKATGDYVCFYDIDDVLYEDAVETLVNAMEKNNTDLVACGFDMYDGKKIYRTVRKTAGIYDADTARKNYARHLSMYAPEGIQGAPWYKLYKMSVIRENHIEFPNIRKSEDEVFMARYVDCISSFELIERPLYRYYVNTGKRFWKKYPFDMFDTAIESVNCMLDFISKWNDSDTEAKNWIYSDYYRKTFSSVHFLFNPRLKLTVKQRYRRLKEITDKYISDIPTDFSMNETIFKYMKNKQYIRIYIHTILYIIYHLFD